jgi:dsDNA-specific endonuclease/ATPase MutS2
LFFTRQNQPSVAPLNITEQFKAKDFSGAKKLVAILKQQAWLIQLDEPELIIDAQKLKESFFKPTEEKQEVQKPVSELDLHIEKLRDDYQFLSSSEILNIQTDHFKKALDGAIVHQMPDITFIHGTGNGILKHELHKLLSKHPKVQTFMDARKEKFGYGATKVILK